MSEFVIDHSSGKAGFDKSALVRFFQRDPALYAYHLGDLDPFFIENTDWWTASVKNPDSESGDISAALLLYTAFDMPVILALADNQAQGALWHKLLNDLPTQAHVHYQARHENIIRRCFEHTRLGLHYKMSYHSDLDQRLDRKGDSQVGSSAVKQLGSDDEKEISALLQAGNPGSYFDRRLLSTDKCLGIFEGSRLVSFGACHVYSPEYEVATLGAITTHPDWRGQGLATKITRALMQALLPTVENLCLNVHSENRTAIGIYQRLGFEVRHEYQEALINKL